MPAYTPRLPKAVAMKNSIPSEILSAPGFLALFLSSSIIKNAIKFIARKKPAVYNILLFILLAPLNCGSPHYLTCGFNFK